jgi:hypothetical protein
LQKSKEAAKDDQIHLVEVTEDKPQTEDKKEEKDVPPEFNALHQILKQYKVNMSIKKIAEQSPCCIKFLQGILKTNDDQSEEEFISLSTEFHHTHEVLVVVRFDGEGFITFHVRIRGEYIGEGLCDSRANANLMSVTKANELGNLKMSPYPHTIGYANATQTMQLAYYEISQLTAGESTTF